MLNLKQTRFIFVTLISSFLFCSAELRAIEFQAVTIVSSPNAGPIETRYAELLQTRLHKQAPDTNTIIDNELRSEAGNLNILLGVKGQHALLDEFCRQHKIVPPSKRDPGREGFVLEYVADEEAPLLIASAFEERAVLYAIGEILRRLDFSKETFNLYNIKPLRSAPAFKVRGTEVGQGHTMLQLTGARKWTDNEWKTVVLDYALAGANTFSGGHALRGGENSFQFFKDYGLQTLTSLSPTSGSGPEEWKAVEAVDRKGHLCLSVPEARESILKNTHNRYKNSRSNDFIRMFSGDGGGCECERCAPYGNTYIHMCADMAKIIHQYHPETKIFATNQKLDNAGDQAIFDYLNEKPHKWLTAIAYGPGSNAMLWQPGRRQNHRMDLFEYPRFGPTDGYLREMLNQLPPEQSIVFFTDLTHWVYSQNGLVDYHPIPDLNQNTPPPPGHWIYEKHPEPNLAQVYNRRTFHARPKYHHYMFREKMRYGDGDVTYSEGHHDHFNQWMWQRLMWNPHMSVEQVTREYAETWFGRQAADTMTKAIFLHEENLSRSLDHQESFLKQIALIREAGQQMTAQTRKTNYLWRQYMQRALLDRYIYLKVQQQKQALKTIESSLTEGIRTEMVVPALTNGIKALDSLTESSEMQQLKAEVQQLGDESDRLFGVRNTGLFNLDKDFVGLAWYRRQLEQALKAEPDQQNRLAELIVHYKDPGPGGFYDNAGTPGEAPHMTYGWPYSGSLIPRQNLHSQRSMAFTAEEDQGVTFSYEKLDPKARYRVRVSLIKPFFKERFSRFQFQKSESIYADNQPLVKDLKLPTEFAELFEYDIPPSVTEDGKLEIRFEKSAGTGEFPFPQLKVWRNTGGWGTVVSEIWLIKEKTAAGQ